MNFASFRTRSSLWALVPFGKALYREQALAVFRLITSLTFFSIFPIIAPLAGEHQDAIRIVLFAYALFSLAILARVFLAQTLPAPFLIVVHTSDLLWPSLICLFTGCAHSPFFVLFIFALLAAPYRRKALETLIIAVASVLIALSESVVAALPAFTHLHLVGEPLQPAHFAVQAAIVLVSGGFLAYVAYWSQREQQAYATRSILQRLHADAGIQANLREILPAILGIFEAKKVVLVLRSSSTWRAFEWGARADRPGVPIYRNLPANEEEQYFWPMPSTTSWSLASTRSGAHYDSLALDRAGFRTKIDSRSLHGELLWHQPFRTLLTTTLQFGSEWTGRIFLVDAACGAGRESCLRLLQQLADEVGPAVYNFYLWRHTSVRVRAIERQRVARDLHDGVVQSLIATEMQLELLRRQSQSPSAGNTSDPVAEAQHVIRLEVRRLREQIDQLRSSTPPRQVVPCLAEMLDKFQRETGIVTNFSCNVREECIPRRVSHELVRILEEALSNVRKHSGARKVDVRLISRDSAWDVVIQDDGRGLDFTGRLSLAQLEATRKGPRVIRERVHAVNGELALESWPDRGTRLEIRFAMNG